MEREDRSFTHASLCGWSCSDIITTRLAPSSPSTASGCRGDGGPSATVGGRYAARGDMLLSVKQEAH
ncbi:hypothetical protein MATL_G00191880 [Megalops atlanticus]|uniref:Uncharacterized protein n=1 Tax=Megalops atlanticus TaxID=7932 RepID=A0A9D3T5Y9_MEGAT|nr:hypothetical protein MATL_G00191880 [Megalops atlanticus]